jgi:hypothetical protein
MNPLPRESWKSWKKVQKGGCDVAFRPFLENESFLWNKRFIKSELTALSKAAFDGRKAMIKVLIEGGADPNDFDQ